ncbi:hypothetical protein DSO57_1016435 [Entomophthora muscae]|uniref:Uncharacterized protein n=1 Tax=Entomophthora muscae TaxID=34485 RepID=A0ACC2SHS0_9FUNG|nr:hypothetical protein DSO57_1016435 [Entomophthora muscae]
MFGTSTNTGFGGFGGNNNASAAPAWGQVNNQATCNPANEWLGDGKGTSVHIFKPTHSKEPQGSYINVYLQSIDLQPEYKKFNFLELRMQDYLQERIFGENPEANKPQPNNGTRTHPYAETREKDLVQNAFIHYQSITFMPQYKGNSFEELRMEDYRQGLVFASDTPSLGSASSSFGSSAFGNLSRPSGFGSTPAFAAAPSGFGTNAAASTGLSTSGFGTSSGFGAKPSTGFGATSAPATGFGTQAASGFGSSTFGATSAPAFGGFGASTASPFGSNAAQTKPAFGFGASQPQSGFGAASNSGTGFGNAAASGFGSTSSGGFGSTTSTGFGSTGTSGFGNTPSSGFGNTTSTGFGSSGTTSFGASTATGFGTSGFGSTSSGGFGNTASTGFGSTGTTGFGASAATGFGNTGFGTSTATGFGANATTGFSKTASTGFGAGGFGGQAAAPTGFGNTGFGGQAAAPFGGTQSSGFGSNPSLGTGFMTTQSTNSFGQASNSFSGLNSLQANNTTPAKPSASSLNPYGDILLFEEILKENPELLAPKAEAPNPPPVEEKKTVAEEENPFDIDVEQFFDQPITRFLFTEVPENKQLFFEPQIMGFSHNSPYSVCNSIPFHAPPLRYDVPLSKANITHMFYSNPPVSAIISPAQSEATPDSYP